MIQKKKYRGLQCIPFFLICLLLAGNTIAAAAEPVRNPNSAKACAICHYRWIDTFFVEGRGTDLVPYQSEKVVAQPEMCISCHDGSVLDSRARLMHGKGHKTDVKPSAAMRIPEIFPLDENGKVQCATCHTAHGVESGPDSGETIFLRTSNRDSAMCRICHPDKDGGPDAGNHSLAVVEKPLPQALKMSGAHLGRTKNQIICGTCHTAHGSMSEMYLARDDRDSSLCLDCHTNKGMFDPSGRRNSNHAFNVKPTLSTVAKTLQNDGSKLGFDGMIVCQTCHKIHNNKTRQAALLIQDNRKSDLCLACHPDKQRLEKTKHNLTVWAKAEKNLAGETAMESGMCSACHLPHRAARKPYAKEKVADRTSALCMSCHGEGMVAENKKLLGYRHPEDVGLTGSAEKAGGSLFRTIVRKSEHIDLPLFNKFGVEDPKGKITCATCHDIHGRAVIQETLVTGNDVANTKNTILRKPSPELCRECHANKFAIENSRHDLNTVFPQGNEILRQKVLQPDLCGYCHLVHSSGPDGFIWKRKITTRTGEQVDDMCTTCHAKNGLASEMAVGKNSHPVNTPLTGKAHTKKLPLFNAAGKITETGIMTCFTCHDPHRWSPIKSKSGTFVSIEGRPASHFLRVEVAPGSDLCISCHEDKADVLQSDHNLLVTAPNVKNAMGWTPYESGICGVCHIVHNSSEKIDLWAMAPGTGSNVMERMCNSCHSKNGAAAAKVPQISSHPDTLFVSVREGMKGQGLPFPFFDTKTGRISVVGNISCPSCHDVHHWGGKSIQGKPQGNNEGNATTSFLRPHVPERVCRQCHGIEGLFVFKYFHDAEKRTRK
jgi:predicted CXXCH cytochrome family protein